MKSHPVERAAAAVSAVSLGGASAFAVFTLLPVAGYSLMAAVLGAGAVSLGAGLYLLGRVARPQGAAIEHLQIPPIVEAIGDSDGLGKPCEMEAEVDVLLLDDPIVPDLRVVQLFEREQPMPLPEPGELVARISDYLGSGRAVAPVETGAAAPVDASAALHAALADIRQSLRR